MASEYGWRYDDIMEIFIEDLPLLVKSISLRQIDNRLMETQIAMTPHADEAGRKSFVEALQAERRKITGIEENAKLDRAALNRLKNQLSEESKMLKVK